LAENVARDLRPSHTLTSSGRGKAAPPVAVLPARAKATLLAPVVPCARTDQAGPRCRVAAVVGNP
jgi:hypothetical protein